MYIVGGSLKAGLYSEVFPYSEFFYLEVLLYATTSSFSQMLVKIPGCE